MGLEACEGATLGVQIAGYDPCYHFFLSLKLGDVGHPREEGISEAFLMPRPRSGSRTLLYINSFVTRTTTSCVV